MTVFESIKSWDVDGFTEWLDEYGAFDTAPWMRWYDNNYCNKCEPVIENDSQTHREQEFSWCELNGKCRYFKELDEIPDHKQIIKMWLESEYKGE